MLTSAPFSHINRRTQFENPVLEAKRRLQQPLPCPGLAALPLPAIYRGEAPSPWLPSGPTRKGVKPLPPGQRFWSWPVSLSDGGFHLHPAS